MKKLVSVVYILMILLFISCQDILECIINRHPELSNKTLVSAKVNQFYSETITANIKNEPLDDNYDYYFSIDGELPQGIEYYIEYRTVILEGTPLVSGSYNFKVYLSAVQSYNYSEACENNFNDCDGLCKESTSKVYTIVVN